MSNHVPSCDISFTVDSDDGTVPFCGNITCSTLRLSVNTAQDLSNLYSCSTITGDLVISSNFNESNAQLLGVKNVQGSLIIENVPSIQNLSLEIETIGKGLVLRNLTSLASVSLNGLKSVGNITWSGLPQLKQVESSSLTLTAGDVLISGTVLPGLGDLDIISTGNLQIMANIGFVNITLSASTANQITVSENGIGGQGSGSSVSLPNLTKAGQMSFEGCSNISAPLLEQTSGSLILSRNSLSSLSLPSLATIGGALVMNGTFTNLDFPKLNHVEGAFNILNNGTSDVCSGFAGLKQNVTKLPSATYACQNDAASSSNSSSTPIAPPPPPPSSTSTDAPAATTTPGAATLNKQSYLGLILVIAVGLVLV
ncbi:hypothetical protein MMC24_003643 [Lignoscripta atroalba]|nr:hypothetical protein [Lignoscripta atroalba]